MRRTLGAWMSRSARVLVASQGADPVAALVIGERVPYVHIHVVVRHPGAPEEYCGPQGDEWAAAPRGGPHDIEALCAPAPLAN